MVVVRVVCMATFYCRQHNYRSAGPALFEVLRVSVLPICSGRKKEKNNACGC
ncbi:hypothetical protein Nmel_000691 [Mimus melanotis]